MEAILQQISEAAGPLIAVYLTLAGSVILDFLSGVYAAVRSGTFDFKFIDAFVKDHLFQKVVPIMAAFAFAAALGGADTIAGAALLTTAGAALAAYEAATLKSIFDNFGAASTKTGNVPDGVKSPVIVGEAMEFSELESAELELSDEQVERIADALAAKLGAPPTG